MPGASGTPKMLPVTVAIARNLLLCVLLGTGAGCTREAPTPGSTPTPVVDATEPSPTGLFVRLRWVGEARDALVPGIPGVAECAADAPAGNLVVGEDSGLANAIVHVAAAPGVPDVPADVTLTAGGCRFSPSALVVTPGTPLRLQNQDSALHTFHLWSVADGVEANLANVAVPPGVPPSRFVLAEPGLYRVGSDRFAHMEAWILVAPGGTGGVTDADGRLELPSIPPGEHAVEILHPQIGSRTQRLTVPAEGAAALHVDLPPGG